MGQTGTLRNGSRNQLFPALAVALLLMAASPLHAGPQGAARRWVRLEGLSCGFPFLNSAHARTINMARLAFALNRLRFGIQLDEVYRASSGNEAMTLLPVDVGFTLISRPARTACFYGALPDMYLEASGGFLDMDEPENYNRPMLRAALRADMDYCGLSIRLETGWRRYSRYQPMTSIYAELQLRVLAFTLAF